MADPVLSTFPQLGEPIGKTMDGQDVLLNESFQQLLEQLFLRTGGTDDSVVQANNIANGIRFGSVPLSGVIIDGRGSLAAELDSLNSNTAAARDEAASEEDPANNKLTLSSSSAAAYGQEELGTIYTNAVTFTAAGGTPPYSIAYSKQSGDDIQIESPTAFTTRFFGNPQDILSGTYCATVTDSAATPATAKLCFPVTLFRPQEGGLG